MTAKTPKLKGPRNPRKKGPITPPSETSSAITERDEAEIDNGWSQFEQWAGINWFSSGDPSASIFHDARD